jgi:SHS2 domain-containing protein
VLPHTADVMLEAWGPDLAACCEEAVAALAAVYLDATDAAALEHRSLHLPAATGEALLVALLDEVIFTLDTAVGVPVRATVTAAVDGGLDVVLALAAPDDVPTTGAVPKGVSRSELVVDEQPGRVSCRFLVDV